MSQTPHHPRDPFEAARKSTGTMCVHAQGVDVPLILRYPDLRAALKDWETYSSDDLRNIVLHGEQGVRDGRQYPIETDPPEHKAYRKIVDPFFRRPLDNDYRVGMQQLLDDAIQVALGNEIDAIHDFALPVQSKSLAMMLNVDMAEADEWVGWGTHVFYDGDGKSKGDALTDYNRAQFAKTAGSGGDDFYSVLNRAEYDGRPLTDEEKLGFANLAFAGGRDTVIGTITGILAHLGDEPDVLEFLRADEKRLSPATEEYLRFISPVTVLARKCPHGATVGDQAVPPGGRAGVCYASANYDETVFPDPHQLKLDRSPNPHIAFGFGKHFCLGAHQARLIIRCLLLSLCDKVSRVEIIDAVTKSEKEVEYTREIGFEKLSVRLHAK
ncbi:MAG: cytochrome P450 [Planctomycetota bacterium]